jgi:competence protein ComFC
MSIIDLFFPKFCLGCGYLGVYICPECIDKLSPIKQHVCFYCKKPSLYGLTHALCSNKLYFDGLISIYHYSPILKKIIKNIKYRLALDIWREFQQIIPPETINQLDFYKKLPRNYFIQPIPLNAIKYNDRGFNQAELISNYFNIFLKFPKTNLLVRKSEISSQAQTKNRKERYHNIKGVFEINSKCRNVINHASTKNIILVDDVITSGATVNEAAGILKKVGINKVYILTLAKG